MARHRRPWMTTVLFFVLGFAFIFTAWPQIVSAAQYSFGNDEYPDLGWKQRAVLGVPIPTAHMDNGGTACGSSYDQDFTDAIVWWNNQGTAGLFQFATSTCSPQTFPAVRVVPYRQDKGATGWYGQVYNYDKHPTTGTLLRCYESCNYGENAATGAQTGYDLSEIVFNAYSGYSFDYEWVAKHELAHTLGQDDQYTGSGCNPNYVGLLDNYQCHSSLTSAEKDSVDDSND